MTDDKSQIINLLKNLKLFNGLDIDQLDLVADVIRPIPMKEADTIHVAKTAAPEVQESLAGGERSEPYPQHFLKLSGCPHCPCGLLRSPLLRARRYLA